MAKLAVHMCMLFAFCGANPVFPGQSLFSGAANYVQSLGQVTPSIEENLAYGEESSEDSSSYDKNLAYGEESSEDSSSYDKNLAYGQESSEETSPIKKFAYGSDWSNEVNPSHQKDTKQGTFPSEISKNSLRATNDFTSVSSTIVVPPITDKPEQVHPNGENIRFHATRSPNEPTSVERQVSSSLLETPWSPEDMSNVAESTSLDDSAPLASPQELSGIFDGSTSNDLPSIETQHTSTMPSRNQRTPIQSAASIFPVDIATPKSSEEHRSSQPSEELALIDDEPYLNMTPHPPAPNKVPPGLLPPVLTNEEYFNPQQDTSTIRPILTESLSLESIEKSDERLRKISTVKLSSPKDPDILGNPSTPHQLLLTRKDSFEVANEQTTSERTFEVIEDLSRDQSDHKLQSNHPTSPDLLPHDGKTFSSEHTFDQNPVKNLPKPVTTLLPSHDSSESSSQQQQEQSPSEERTTNDPTPLVNELSQAISSGVLSSERPSPMTKPGSTDGPTKELSSVSRNIQNEHTAGIPPNSQDERVCHRPPARSHLDDTFRNSGSEILPIDINRYVSPQKPPSNYVTTGVQTQAEIVNYVDTGVQTGAASVNKEKKDNRLKRLNKRIKEWVGELGKEGKETSQ